MKYINPYSLLGLQSQSEEELKKAKKRFLAELQLSESDTVQLQGQEIHKSEFLQALNTLEQEEQRELFWELATVYNSTHRFLQEGKSEQLKGSELRSLRRNNSLWKALSPYLVEPLAKLVKESFRGKDLLLLEKIQEPISMLGSDEEQRVWLWLQGELEGIEREWEEALERMNSVRELIVEREGLKLAKKVQELPVAYLNQLGDYFEQIRSSIAGFINDCSVCLFQATQFKIKEVVTLCGVAAKLESTEIISVQIKRNYASFLLAKIEREEQEALARRLAQERKEREARAEAQRKREEEARRVRERQAAWRREEQQRREREEREEQARQEEEERKKAEARQREQQKQAALARKKKQEQIGREIETKLQNLEALAKELKASWFRDKEKIQTFENLELLKLISKYASEQDKERYAKLVLDVSYIWHSNSEFLDTLKELFVPMSKMRKEIEWKKTELESSHRQLNIFLFASLFLFVLLLYFVLNFA